jgi:deoxycytidylate deaminase
MRLARKLSEKSEHKFQVGAVIVKGNKVLGIGFNKVKTSPQSIHPWRTRHAECDALISCGLENTVGATAYVYRLLKNGSGAMSKPCESCEKMLKTRGIKKVYYTSPVESGWETEDYG